MRKKILALVLSIVTLLSTTLSASALDNNKVSILDSSVDDKLVKLVELKIAEKDEDITVNEIKTVTDFNGDIYKVIECYPSGYFIYHLDSGILVEYSIAGKSPFLNKTGEIYYFGPANSYEKVNGKYIHTLFKTEIAASDEKSLKETCDKVTSELLLNKNNAALNYLTGKTSEQEFINSNTRTITSMDSMVTGYSWFNKPTNFGYISGNKCGYIRSNLILKYWDYRLSNFTLPSSHATVSSTALSNALYNIGVNNGYSNLTFGPQIKNVINTYASTYGLPQVATYSLTSSGVANEIRNNKRPCILFGNVPNPSGGSFNHAFVVYGVNSYENVSGDTFICHFGLTNYHEVHLYSMTSVFEGHVKYNPA